MRGADLAQPPGGGAVMPCQAGVIVAGLARPALRSNNTAAEQQAVPTATDGASAAAPHSCYALHQTRSGEGGRSAGSSGGGMVAAPPSTAVASVPRTHTQAQAGPSDGFARSAVPHRIPSVEAAVLSAAMSARGGDAVAVDAPRRFPASGVPLIDSIDSRDGDKPILNYYDNRIVQSAVRGRWQSWLNGSRRLWPARRLPRPWRARLSHRAAP